MKIRVAVIFGGTNTEHEVSLVSAKSIIDNLDRDKYEIIPIKITKDNTWVSAPIMLSQKERKLLPTTRLTKNKQELPTVYEFNGNKIDVIFPVIHGPYGEDGTLQGMLEMARIPYVGCGVLGSAICMDKVIQKQVCQSQNIPVPKYIWFSSHDWEKDQSKILDKVNSLLKYPVFVKPANQGSSIGITKVKEKYYLIKAINQALTLDQKILVEQAIPNAREIECSVLGNENPESSILGEIIPSNEFYDYDAKYVDGVSKEIIPAKLPEEISYSIRKLAVKAFKTLNCSGLARVDFLLNNKTNKYYLNELNTMPGFTSISMYPKLWEASGLNYPKLLDKLINYAIKQHKLRSSLNISYQPKSNWHNI